jgi:hypothetical protein
MMTATYSPEDNKLRLYAVSRLPRDLYDRVKAAGFIWAIVGSSNFTGPGLVSNKELNLVHRVILPTEEAVDREAAERVGYLETLKQRETLLDPSGVDVPEDARRFIKSEVGARAITDLMTWYERQWADSVDFKDGLVELLDASKFGTKEPDTVLSDTDTDTVSHLAGECVPQQSAPPDQKNDVEIMSLEAARANLHATAAEARWRQ